MSENKNIAFRTLEIPEKKATLSLCVVRFDEEALETYTEWMNDHENIKFLGRSDQPASIEDERDWLTRQKENKSNFTFNIVLKDDGGEHLIGNCSVIVPNNSIHNGILGITIGNKLYKGQHFGRYALGLLLDWAFSEKNLHCISLTVAENNLAAIKCYESVGFKKQGIHRDTFYFEGTYINTVYMDIMRDEFEKNIVRS